ncbi:hypothetical protein F66182_7959 [Fusarium sp. NRRL 66182]|nr:hypothetical protein F66182_7959 [Fusarium sp. NRRL 66182]
MDTVYPAFHNAPLDGARDFDAYTPAPNINFDHTAMNPYETLAQGSWGQWWSPDHAVLAESSVMSGSQVSPQQEEQGYNNYTYGFEPLEQWATPATSTHSYPITSPSTDPTSIDATPGDSESRRGSSSAQNGKRKRKRSTNQTTSTKSTRRGSTKKNAAETGKAAVKPKTRSNKSRKASLAQPADEPCPDQDDELLEDHTRRVQERNRIASNKFRIKKRADAIKLRADEEDMEQANRDLSHCVSDLTQQVYELKMRLLQHTDCGCHLIQDYIANEAHKFIKDLGDGRPQMPPQRHYQDKQ